MAGHNVLSATSSVDIIQHSGAEIQVIHATPEQVAQLQQTHQIQILQGEQVVVSWIALWSHLYYIRGKRQRFTHIFVESKVNHIRYPRCSELSTVTPTFIYCNDTVLHSPISACLQNRFSFTATIFQLQQALYLND